MKKIIKFVPMWALAFIILAILSGIIHFISVINVDFAEFFNLKISTYFRILFAKITGIFPFSVAEILIIMLPVWVFILIFLAVRYSKKERTARIRFLTSVFALITFFYSSFVLTFATAYRGKSLEEKLQLERESVSSEEILNTLEIINSELSVLVTSTEYESNGFSVMPYNFSELNKKLNEAYESVSGKYDFINSFKSNAKQILLSGLMTYTHISGVYTFFSGEANVNVNYPDYVIPFTVAHEMAHQRGIAREDEANFIAFLVCIESDDLYIKYSAYFNVFEYLFSSLIKADIQMAKQFVEQVPREIFKEMDAYSEFFRKYDDNFVADVSDKVNNSYLISQGQTEGVKSYGLVTELTVAYYKSMGK